MASPRKFEPFEGGFRYKRIASETTSRLRTGATTHDAAGAAGKNVDPQRLQTTGILGVDNLLRGRFDPRKGIRLSSINPGFHEAGRLALTLLLEHVLHGDNLRETLRVPPENLIELASFSNAFKSLTGQSPRAWRGGRLTSDE